MTINDRWFSLMLYLTLINLLPASSGDSDSFDIRKRETHLRQKECDQR